jgi:hypothetical protein
MGYVGADQTWGGLHSIECWTLAYRKRKCKQLQRCKLVELSFPNCQLYQCNTLLLVTDNPHTMIIQPSILRPYGLRANVSQRDLIGTFLLRLIKNIIIMSSPDDSLLSLLPSLKPDSDQAKVIVVEVKDLTADHHY